MTLIRLKVTQSQLNQLAACCLLPLAIACHQATPTGTAQGASSAAAVEVKTLSVVARPVPRFLTLTGSLTPNQESDVAANVSGVVQKTMVERGSFVRAGQTIATLDVRAAELSRAEAQANLETAKQQRSLADQECARAKGLLASGAMTQQEFDRTTSQCRTALAGSDAAEARARLAEKTLGDSMIKAPFSGLVAERYVSLGEYVSPQTKIVHLVDLDPLRLSLTVPEQDIGSVHQGLAVEFNVATFPDRHFDGSIRYVGPAVRAQTRDLVVEAVVPNHITDNQKSELLPGMFATARVKLGEQPLPVLPRSALRSDETTDRVFVVAAGHLEERIVELGDPLGNEVVISKGLKGGEEIVAEPSAQLADGMAVKATPLAAR